ncbi:hypothetical protein ZIOFF_044356 [Zingiber officinale]|uniref:Uncharacterized protein n=1 Tax=Zingiber officinale TaxID=94328 RepID=A0A8J5G640_ZINOF|nr:hypothetical protein ZIOFF_044356 [Zingiber officinale]
MCNLYRVSSYGTKYNARALLPLPRFFMPVEITASVILPCKVNKDGALQRHLPVPSHRGAVGVGEAIASRGCWRRRSHWIAGLLPANFSDMICDVPELRGDNYKIWKERTLLHLGCKDVDYAIRKDEPPPENIALYEKWERSNRLSIMFIKTKISDGIRGSLEHYDNVRDLLKAIEDQFVSSDKALASTLIHQFSSMKLSGIHGVQEVPQTADPNSVDPEVQQIPEIVEQFVEQHDPATQESVDTTLRTANPNSVDSEVQQIPEIVEQSVEQHDPATQENLTSSSLTPQQLPNLFPCGYENSAARLSHMALLHTENQISVQKIKKELIDASGEIGADVQLKEIGEHSLSKQKKHSKQGTLVPLTAVGPRFGIKGRDQISTKRSKDCGGLPHTTHLNM